MDDPEKLKLRDLLQGLTPKQIWGACAALVALAIAAFSLGLWIAIQKATIEVATERAASQQTTQALQADLTKASGEVAALSTEMSWLILKAELLEHHLRYELTRDASPEDQERATKLFIGFVSRLWKAQEDRNVRAGMELTTSMARVPIIARPVVQKSPPSKRSSARNLEDRRIIKTVKFPDGSVFEIPYPVAAAAHKRE